MSIQGPELLEAAPRSRGPTTNFEMPQRGVEAYPSPTWPVKAARLLSLGLVTPQYTEELCQDTEVRIACSSRLCSIESVSTPRTPND